MKARGLSIARPISSLWTMSPAAEEASTRSWTSVSMRREPADAALLGSACASLVAEGLGTDAGDFDTDTVVARAES